MGEIGKDRLRETDGIITVDVPDPGINIENCQGLEQSDPNTIVIIGATGDLTARKLVPALFNLYLNDGLPDPFRIVGCGRTKLNDQQFRGKMEKALKAKGLMDDSKWQVLVRKEKTVTGGYGLLLRSPLAVILRRRLN